MGRAADPPTKNIVLLKYETGVEAFVAVFPENVELLSNTTVYVPAAACPSNTDGSEEPTENTMPLAMRSVRELTVIFLNKVCMTFNIPCLNMNSINKMGLGCMQPRV